MNNIFAQHNFGQLPAHSSRQPKWLLHREATVMVVAPSAKFKPNAADKRAAGSFVLFDNVDSCQHNNIDAEVW